MRGAGDIKMLHYYRITDDNAKVVGRIYVEFSTPEGISTYEHTYVGTTPYKIIEIEENSKEEKLINEIREIFDNSKSQAAGGYAHELGDKLDVMLGI